MNQSLPGTQSITRAAQILKIVEKYNIEGARLIDLARETGLQRPTVHRILQGLIKVDFVTQPAGTSRYFLGPVFYRLGISAALNFNLRDLYEPALKRIAEATEETVFLTQRSDREAICVARHSGSFPVKVFTLEVGMRRPLGIGSGSCAMLASMEEEECKRLLKENKKHYEEFDEDINLIENVIFKARKQGYVIKDQEHLGIRTVAFTIYDINNKPFAAFSVASITQRINSKRIEEIISLLRKEATQLQKNLTKQTFLSF